MSDILERAGVATEAAFGSRTPLWVFLGSLALAEVGWLALLVVGSGGSTVVVALVGLAIVPLVTLWALRRLANAPQS